jgi:3-hydroxybutyryl-CoA dehydratase
VAEASPEFKLLLKETFEALEVGQTYTFRRTFSEADASAFVDVTSDYNPYHIDKAANLWATGGQS